MFNRVTLDDKQLKELDRAYVIIMHMGVHYWKYNYKHLVNLPEKLILEIEEEHTP